MAKKKQPIKGHCCDDKIIFIFVSLLVSFFKLSWYVETLNPGVKQAGTKDSLRMKEAVGETLWSVHERGKDKRRSAKPRPKEEKKPSFHLANVLKV